mgnify:FL=1
MKSKYLSILSLTLLLVGCSGTNTTPNTSKPSTNPSSTNKQSTNNSSTSKSTKSLFDLFESMKTGLTINGTIKDFDGDDLNQTTTFTTKFSDDSYHYDRKVEDKEGSLDYFKITEDSNEYVGTYDIDENNNLVLTKASDGEGSLSWSMVSNPFYDETSDSGFFDKDNDGNYYLDFSKDGQTAGNRFKAARNFTSKIAILSIMSFDEFKIIVKNDSIDSFHIVSKEANDKDGSPFHYEIDFTINNDKNVDHEANKPVPYEHKDYHDALKSAFDNLFSNPYSFERNVSNISNVKMPHLEGYISSSVMFYQIDDNNFSGALVKDGYVHEITKENGTYYYKEEKEKNSDGSYITHLSYSMPRRSEPIEAFTFDKETNVYSLTIMPDRFAYYFDSFSDLDDSYHVEDVIKAEIKLSNKKIDTVKFLQENGGYVEYKIYSDSSKLPFDINTISEFDSLSKMYGTFTGSFSSTSPFKNQKIQIKVEKKKNTDKYSKDGYVYSVTFKKGLNLDDETEYAGTNVSISDNNLSFECGGYSITIALSNNEYKLTIESDSGKSDSTILTRE